MYAKFFVFIFLFLSMLAEAKTASAALTYSSQSNLVIDDLSFTNGSNGAAITLTNCSNVLISNCNFMINSSVVGVKLNNCSNIEITNNYFENFSSGIYAVNCTGGINIHCNSFKNIAGAKPRGQMVQFNTCSGSGNKVNYNILEHEYGSGNPEDIINMYASSGAGGDPIQIIGNHLRGGGPSTSGGGIMVGDNGSHDILVDGNVLVDVGQYGISAPSGYNITISNNQIYGAMQTWTNVGIYVGLQAEINAGFACSGSTISVTNNLVNFTNKNNVQNGWYNCSCCSGVITSGNNFKASSIISSILPDSLVLDGANCASLATALNIKITKNKKNIFPNPAHEFIQLNEFNQGGICRIFDQLGILQLEVRIDISLQRIDISTLSSGVYFLQHNGEIFKLIKW